MNNKEVAKEIEDILDQTFLRDDCAVNSLARIDDEYCSCRGCVYGYSVRCMSPMIMEEEVKVFR